MDAESAESKPLPPHDDAPESKLNAARDEVHRQQAALFAKIHEFRAAASRGAPRGEATQILGGIADMVRENFAAQERVLRSLPAARWDNQGRIQRRVLDELDRAGAVLQGGHVAEPEEIMHLVDPLLIYLVAEDPFTHW